MARAVVESTPPLERTTAFLTPGIDVSVQTPRASDPQMIL